MTTVLSRGVSAVELLEAEIVCLEKLDAGMQPSFGRVLQARACSAEAAAAALGEESLRRRAQLLIAGQLAESGESDASAQIIREVNRWAQEHGDQYLLARSHFRLCLCFQIVGDNPLAIEHGVLSVNLLDGSELPDIAVVHHMMLGVAFAQGGEMEAGRERMLAAQRKMRGCDNPPLHLWVLNNLAYSYYNTGEPDEAERIADKLLEVTRSHALTLPLMVLDTLARLRLEAGDGAAAVDLLSALPEGERADGVAEALLTDLKDIGTTRNWATLNKIHALMGEGT